MPVIAVRASCLRPSLHASVILAACAWAFPAVAATPPADLCRNAARTAAQDTGVPYDVLMAIALTETGRSRDGALSPWPWTVHHDGKGLWFQTEAEAVAMAQKALDAGATNIDLGCFQLNIRWHAQAFGSVADMIAPDRNARYAAEFLARLYQETGDWSAAAGTYHSRNAQNAEAYRAKFETILLALQDGTPDADGTTAELDLASSGMDLAPRENRFPLLQAGTSAGTGSIVPLLPAGARLVGG